MSHSKAEILLNIIIILSILPFSSSWLFFNEQERKLDLQKSIPNSVGNEDKVGNLTIAKTNPGNPEQFTEKLKEISEKAAELNLTSVQVAEQKPAVKKEQSELETSLLKLLHIADDNFHDQNSARQSLFPSFRLPGGQALGGLGSNPFASSLLKPASFPSLPALPTLPPFPTMAPPRPKTSIIGNNGGPMALTNDNVVVVNVLS